MGSELDRLHEIPTLHSDRLTLDALTEKDKLPYNALCLDEERNRLWGYDWHKDYDGSPMEEYFLSVAREDFRLRRCVNFAVRLGEDFIGEAVLYNPDWQGRHGAGLPHCPGLCRPRLRHRGLCRSGGLGLYGLGLARVVAKCFKENGPSYKMLSSCMRETGQDETYFYFEKNHLRKFFKSRAGKTPPGAYFVRRAYARIFFTHTSGKV